MHKHTNMYYNLTTPTARCEYIKWVDQQMLTYTGARSSRAVAKYLGAKLSGSDKSYFESLDSVDAVRSTRAVNALQRTLGALRSMVT